MSAKSDENCEATLDIEQVSPDVTDTILVAAQLGATLYRNGNLATLKCGCFREGGKLHGICLKAAAMKKIGVNESDIQGPCLKERG